jgi:nucleotide-binding universal stress UspA family protein
VTRRFKTVVVPTDFSDSAQMALHYGMDLVDPEGKVILCHVVDDIPLTYGYVGVTYSPSELRSNLGTEAEKELQAIVPTNPDGVRIETRVLHGSPPREIVDLVLSEKADLVVMGTHGRTGLEHALMGSVAEKVVRKAPCPVLVVREGGVGFEAEKRD